MQQDKEELLRASDGLLARATGPWVNEKKYYLERYLEIATTAVGKKWEGKLAYADFFAGPGRSIVRGSGDEVDGSPLIALKYDFAKYVFVDVPTVLSVLKARLVSHPKRSQISLIEGDCNSVVDEMRKALPADHLTVAFIDPTGLQIWFETIRRFVEGRKADLLMTIQFGMGIRMNLHQYVQANETALLKFIGDNSWHDDVKTGTTRSKIAHKILTRYLLKLSRLGYIAVEDREIDVKTDKNLLLYFMILATRHPTGAKLWRKATEIRASGQRHFKEILPDV